MSDTYLPWRRPDLCAWRIVGMNHYRLAGADNLYVAMTRDGRVIQAEGADTGAIWDELSRQAKPINDQLAVTVISRD